MQSLSQGFCARAVSDCVTHKDHLALFRDFADVHLQVVDIQRYPAHPLPESGVSRFYVALSDGVSILWGIVPPGTALEQQIGQFELDIGYCARLRVYHLIAASCGLNVVVLIDVVFSENPHSLLGKPVYDSGLFVLSDAALIKPNVTVPQNADDTVASVIAPVSTEITLQDILDRPECVLEAWKIALRVAYKGRVSQIQRHAGGAASSTLTHSHQRQRFLLRFIGVDRNGACMCCVLWMAAEHHQAEFKVGDCLLLTEGSVRWSDTGLPTELHFNKGSVAGKVASEDVPLSFPLFPQLLVGHLATALQSVHDVLSTGSVDDVVSITGTIRSVLASSHVNTKRGRVLCSTISVEDSTNASAIIELTLWGEAAELVHPLKNELWLFHYCTVREFRQRKTLSSRSTSLFCRLNSADEYGDHVSTTPVGTATTLTFAALAALVDGTSECPQLKDGGFNRNDNVPSGTQSNLSSAVPMFRVSLSLEDVVPTLPVLVRLQSVSLFFNSASCSNADDSVALSNKLLHVAVVLSDGLSCMTACGAWPTISPLLDSEHVTAPALVQSTEVTRWGERLCSKLIGAPLLVWLLPRRAGSKEAASAEISLPADSSFCLVHCRHAGMSTCALALLSSLDQI